MKRATLVGLPSLLLFSLLLLPGVAPLAGCSSSSAAPAGPVAYAPPPSSTVIVDQGPVSIRRELAVVRGVTPPPNPVLNKATPAAQNQLRITRYRVDADPPRSRRRRCLP